MKTLIALVVMDAAWFGLFGAACGWLVHYIHFLNRPASLTRGRSLWRYLLIGAVGGVLVWYLARRLEWKVPDLDWILVAALGGFVGIGELASRYRDEPIKAILSVPATIYVVFNAVAAIVALAIGRYFGWFTAAGANEAVAWSHVLAAGLGAMVLLRSSVFQIRVGDKDVAVGPSTFLQSIIDAADRAVDRLRAQERAWAVARVMEKVSAKKAMNILPPYISALMQNLKPEEQGAFEAMVTKIRDNKDHSDQVKILTLGLVAMKFTGEGVLSAAVQSLADEIRQAAVENRDAANMTTEKAGKTKGAIEVAAAAAEKVREAAQATDAPPAIKDAVKEASESAISAVDLSEETLEQARIAAEKADTTVNIVTDVQRASTQLSP
jgi:hypothetical protein